MRPGLGRRPSSVLTFVFGIALSACNARVDARLLEIHRVTPTRAEAGAELLIEGDGFAPGRGAVVVLDGEVRRPGRTPQRVRVSSAAHAVSPERLEWRITDELLTELGGRGTFAGTLEVELAAAHGAHVTGRLDGLELDFAAAASQRLGDELHLMRRGRELLERVGITPTRDDGMPGIGVDAVTPLSSAALSGVAKGDRVVSMDGVRLGTVADFVPAPGLDTIVLELSRPGEPSGLRVPVPIGDVGSTAAATHQVVALAVGALVLLLCFLAPTARLTGHAVHVFSASLRRGRALGRRPRSRTLKQWVIHGGWSIVVGMAVVLAFGVLPLAAREHGAAMDVGLLVLVAFAARLASLLDSSTVRRRLARVVAATARTALDAAPALLALAAVAATCGTLRLSGIAAAQGGDPWDWYAFRNPVTFVAFTAWIGAAAAAHGTKARADGGLTAVASRVHLFVSSALGAALFMGGFGVPGSSVVGDPLGGEVVVRVVAVAAFVVKAAALMVATSELGRRAVTPERWWRWTIPVGGAAAAAATGALAWGVPIDDVERVTGPVLCAVAALVTVVVVTRAVWPPRAPSRVQPFL